MNEKTLKLDTYKEANEYAENIISEILLGFKDPTHKISGEAKEIYEELNLFKWFEDTPLVGGDGNSFYVKLISTQRYKELMSKQEQEKDSEHVQKKSKWERVMGVVT